MDHSELDMPKVRARVTVLDVARTAGVSTATVDRVLNNRPGVRRSTQAAVLKAAAGLGYGGRDGDADGELRHVRLHVVVPSGTNTFLKMLAEETVLADGTVAHGLRAHVRVHRTSGYDPAALAGSLLRLRGLADGVAVVAIDHPTVRDAIRALTQGGCPVLTLVTDLPNTTRFDYVGIDNRAAGRTAGLLVDRFVRRSGGAVALLCGSLSYRGHEEREMGFRHIMAEGRPDFRLVETREVQDDAERSLEVTRALLADETDLRAIYNIGGGNRGVATALEEAGRARDVVFIGHEVTPHTRRYLLSGTMDAVIHQSPREEAREAIGALLGALANPRPGRQRSIQMQIVLRENIPDG